MQPNTMITMEFSKKADGTEYDNLVSSQSVKSLEPESGQAEILMLVRFEERLPVSKS